jgi:hypothetical protein
VPVDVGVGRGRPAVAGTLVELKRWKPMGGGESSFEVVGDDDGIGDTSGDAFRWNRECIQVGFGHLGSHKSGQCDLGLSDCLKGWANGGNSIRVRGWLDG